MRVAMLIASKDLRQRLRDRSALVVVLVIPFVLAAILGLTLGNATSGKVRSDVALLGADRGQAAAGLATTLAQLERQGIVRVRRASSLAQARSLAEEGSVAAAFYLPAGFSRAVASGGGAVVTVIGDTNQPIGTLVAQSIAQGYAAQLDGVRLAVATAASTGAIGSESPAQLAAAAARVASPITVQNVSAKSGELDPKTFYAAGMAVFFLFFTVQFGISTLLDERRDGTLARLLAAPCSRAAIIAGKALTSIVLGFVGTVALALASSLLLGANWGNVVGVAVLILAGVLAATAVMALVVTIARTPEQAGYWQAIVALVLGMFGGTFFPVYQAGGAIETLSLFTPQAWFLRGLREMTGGASVSAAIGPAAVMLGIALGCGLLTLLRADRLLSA